MTTLHFVPSMLQALLAQLDAHACASVRRIVCSGEALPAEARRQVLERLPGVALHNLYGPTEAAIDVTHWTCHAQERGPVPIGRPIAGLRTHVLDAAMQPVPPGAPGELFLGGAGLARGYAARPGLTAERFVADPFEPGARLYRTGDLVRWRGDGSLEYLGRLDHQVKIRGQRIELGEIEARLLARPGVREAVAVAASTPAGTALVAYCSPHAGATLDGEALRARLAAELPEAMVPSQIAVLPALPLNANGKVDRKALPSLQPASAATYTAPQGEGGGGAGAHVVRTAGAAARRPHRPLLRPGRPFADGHAARRPRALGPAGRDFGAGRLPAPAAGGPGAVRGSRAPAAPRGGRAVAPGCLPRRYGDCRMSDMDALLPQARMARRFMRLTDAQRRAAYAKMREEGLTMGQFPILPREARDGEAQAGQAPLSYAQMRQWFLWQMEPQGSAYHITGAFVLRGALDVPALEAAWRDVIARHAALRTVFRADAGGHPHQQVLQSVEFGVHRIDLSDLPEPERCARAEAAARACCETPFDLGEGPLLRVWLLRTGAGEHRLVVAMHHIVSDGWSLRVLVESFAERYRARHAGEGARGARCRAAVHRLRPLAAPVDGGRREGPPARCLARPPGR